MDIFVTKDKVTIDLKSYNVHKGEYNVTECNFTFDENFDTLNKRAIFTIQNINKSYEVDIVDNKCNIPYDVLEYDLEMIELGVYGYTLNENNKLQIRLSPCSDEFPVCCGSYKPNSERPTIITPDQYDIYSQALQEGLNKVDNALQETIETSEYAQQQGNYAKEQSDYAKAQADNAKNATDDLIEKEKNGELNGATFIPNVDFSGNLSWTNDKNLDNPETVNITGPQGPKGDCNFATFDIDAETGNLVMTKPDDMSQVDFSLNKETGNLEVIVNV